jgi:predicted ArsR family transcriptional regulator
MRGTNVTQEGEIRREVLVALRDLSRQQNDTAAILSLDLEAIAGRLGVSRAEVRNQLCDLLIEGYAEGFAETQTDRAVNGHCRITPAGLAALREG